MAKKEKSEAAAKVAKAEKAQKTKTPKPGKENVFARFGKGIAKFFKDFKGETKKIVWPERQTVIKSTGVVLAVVAVIGVIIFGIDTGLTKLIELLSKAATDFASTAATTVAEATTAAQTTAAAATQAATTVINEVTTAVATTVG